jgi:hypothetical protein
MKPGDRPTVRDRSAAALSGLVSGGGFGERGGAEEVDPDCHAGDSGGLLSVPRAWLRYRTSRLSSITTQLRGSGLHPVARRVVD